MTRFVLMAVVLMLSAIAQADDGIRPDSHFKVPFAVDGDPVVNRSTIRMVEGKPYLVVLYVKGDSIKETHYLLTRQDAPDPEPDPDPDPDPDPKPVALWAVVIEESSQRTPEQAAILASPQVRGLFVKDRFRIYDPLDVNDPVPPVELAPYVTRALTQRTKWPWLFLVSPDGDVQWEGTLPETVTEMESLVNQHKARH